MLNVLKTELLKLAKEVQYHSPLRRFFFHRHVYNFTVPQLLFLCQCIEETREIEGAIIEVGCASGATTVFLNKYMDARGIEKKYYAIDTFRGFVAEDVRLECEQRGKTSELYAGFQVNKKKWFDGTMAQNKISRVVSIEADVNNYRLADLGAISFGLLDVDLYRPMKKSLQELFEMLSPGGILVVDDCNSQNSRWDGSYQAYVEFMQQTVQPIQVVHGKLGIVRKAR